MKAIGYIRVSTEGQAEDGVSLDAQEAKIRAWAELNDAELLAVHCDAGLSGCRADNRPGLQAALDAACREGAALVVYSLSRLARSTEDAIGISKRLDKAGADLVSLSEKIDTTSATGKMIFRLLAVLAEFERDQVAERTAAALAHKKAKGEKTGGDAPYGWRLAADGVHLEPEAAEQAMILAARRWQEQGQSLRRIGAALAADGMLPRHGGEWSAPAVKRLLSAELAA